MLGAGRGTWTPLKPPKMALGDLRWPPKTAFFGHIWPHLASLILSTFLRRFFFCVVQNLVKMAKDFRMSRIKKLALFCTPCFSSICLKFQLSAVFWFEDVVYKIYGKVSRHPQVEWTKWRVGKVNWLYGLSGFQKLMNSKIYRLAGVTFPPSPHSNW